ncbi:MAG: hypothetical protein Q9N02_05020 [Ghiorsea sp.]|nr:hypothetical protein [Ghiorsea sp.]
MNHFLAALIIIFLPGILAVIICDKIIVHSKWDTFKYSLYAFILGILSYVTLQALYYLYNLADYCSSDNTSLNFVDIKWDNLSIWNSLISEEIKIIPIDLISATILSIPLAFMAGYIINFKIITKLANKFRVSNKYGDENLFSFYLNSPDIDWVYIRDIERDLTYQGRVQSYSETDTIQEIVLYDVKVFRYQDSAELYSIPSIYLSKPIGSFIIEAATEK